MAILRGIEMSAGGRPRVSIVQHSIRLYRAPFFEALRTCLDDAGIELHLIHSNHPEELTPGPMRTTLPWARVIPGRRLFVRDRLLLWQPVLRATRRAALVIVEQATHLLANYALLARQQLGGPPVAFWGHGRNFLVADPSGDLSERTKQLASRRAYWWFAYNDHAAGVVEAFGYPRQRITVVYNATDTRGLARHVEAARAEEVSAARREFPLVGENVGLYLGTLGAAKRLGYLFAAAELVRAAVPDFELVITGRGMEESRVREWCRERPWAHYAGSRFGAELAPLLAAAKVLLVPAWVGLVVVDSFAAGVPLVTSASSPHPPEIDYLEHGVNGLMVEDGGDAAVYAAAVTQLLHDEPRRLELVRGCLRARERYSVEHMAECFSTGIVEALNSQRGRRRKIERAAPGSEPDTGRR
jgi:glycosyltransferase involved in cell wall biosynthesis